MRVPGNKITRKAQEHLDKVKNQAQQKLKDEGLVELDFNNMIKFLLSDGNELPPTESPQSPQPIINRNYINEHEATMRLSNKQDAERVKNMLSEYFNGFILTGYNTDGKRVIIKGSKDDKDDDALVEQLRYLLMKMLNDG